MSNELNLLTNIKTEITIDEFDFEIAATQHEYVPNAGGYVEPSIKDEFTEVESKIVTKDNKTQAQLLPAISTNTIHRNVQRFSKFKFVNTKMYTNETPIKCETSNKLFLKTEDFVQYSTTHIGEQDHKIVDSDNLFICNDYLYKCTICEKEFSDQSTRNIHTITHRSDRQFICTVNISKHFFEKSFACSDSAKAFRQTCPVTKHTGAHISEIPLRAQTNKKPFKCIYCDKAFSQKSVLEIHTRIHTSEKPFACTDCGKSFSRKYNLAVHTITHTAENLFKCIYCDKAFRYKFYLKKHCRRIHASEIPFICIYCNKTFSKKSDLTIHSRNHISEKPFACIDCGKSFSHKSVLEIHTRIHTREKPFPCTDCGKSFSRKHDLTGHTTRIHIAEKPFKCIYCDKAFKYKSQMKKHTRIHIAEKS